VKNGYAKWKNYLNAFGMGHKLGVDLPSENAGNVADTSWYNKTYHGSWNSCTNVSNGIGQGEMLITPVQMANIMAIVANKGHYYVPHFVKKIDNETKEDTILNRFRERHDVLSHISDTLYEIIHNGMQDVVDIGTAQAVKIPGIKICAKTGTAENFRIIDRKKVQLKDNSLFACFAPRENPKIAIAVIVENAGFGSTWAAPMASLMIEKYLTDSIRSEKLPEIDRISEANLMPSYLPRLQYIADSTRAYFYFNLTKDSSYIIKYIKKGKSQPAPRPKKDSVNARFVYLRPDEISNDEMKKKITG
jgi:penicillin-binding protein 2